MAVLKLEFLACSLQAKIFWFPGVRVHGESFGFPGMCPGFMPKNRKHPPSLLFSLMRKAVLTAPPGRLHCAAAVARVPSSAEAHAGATADSQGVCIVFEVSRRNTARLDICWIACELLAQGCSVPMFNHAAFLLMISMVVFKYVVCYSSLL